MIRNGWVCSHYVAKVSKPVFSLSQEHDGRRLAISKYHQKSFAPGSGEICQSRIQNKTCWDQYETLSVKRYKQLSYEKLGLERGMSWKEPVWCNWTDNSIVFTMVDESL